MFILDDLIRELTASFVKRLESNREAHDDTIHATKTAMRGLSASFGEILELFRARAHTLRRLMAQGDNDAFWSNFSELVDEDRLRSFCNAAGICRDLDLARDSLLALPRSADSREAQLIGDLATQISSQEWAFIRAIQNYLAGATEHDLMAAANQHNLSPSTVCDELERCIEGLASQKNSLDGVLDQIRARALRPWI